MNEGYLRKLIRRVRRTKCEWQESELKKAGKGTPGRLYDTFSSFANQRGGETLGDTTRFIDNQRLEGAIPRMLKDSLAFVRRNSKTATVIRADGKRADRDEYPLLAVREIILNALIHRDYSHHTENSPARIMICADRLEVENPGGLYGRMTIEELGKTAGDTRNPFLAGDLEVLKITENRFSGIPTIKTEMENANLPPPVFKGQQGKFTVILYNKTQGSLSEATAPHTSERTMMI